MSRPQPRLRTATAGVGAAALLALLSVVAGSQVGAGPEARVGPWRVSLRAEPQTPARGADVILTITVENRTGDVKPLTFPPGPQIRLEARDAAGVRWRSAEASSPIQVSRLAGPGGRLRYERTWPTAGLRAGHYLIEGSVLARELGGRAAVDLVVVLT